MVHDFAEQKEKILADNRRQILDWWGISDSDILTLKPDEILRKAVGLNARKVYEFNNGPNAVSEAVAELRPALPQSEPDGVA